MRVGRTYKGSGDNGGWKVDRDGGAMNKNLKQ